MGRCIFFLSTQGFVAEYGYTGDYTYTDAAHAELASIWGFAVASNRVTFRHNLFTHIEGVGGLIFDNQESPTGGGMKVYGNIFYRPANDTWVGGNGAVGGWTGNGGEQMHDVEVYNNTFVNLNIPALGSLSRISSGNIAYNNIFYNSGSVDFSVFTTHDYNWFYNSGGTAGEAHGQAGAANPFASITNLDFRLTAQTNPGTTLPAPYNVDINGVTRGASGGWTRGVYQFTAGGGGLPEPPTGLLTLAK
jgi:hypothetical protein